MSYVPAFERRYKSIGNVLNAITDLASRDTVIDEDKSRLDKAGKTTGKAAAIAKEVSVLNTALAHASEEGRAEDVYHLAEELNGWAKHQVDVGHRTALTALRQENAGQAKVAEQELSQLRGKGLEKDKRIRELEAGATSQEDTTLRLRNENRDQKVALEENEKIIRSLEAQLEQQKQQNLASVTEVTEWKNKVGQTRSELQTQIQAMEDQAAGLKKSLDTERARADDFEIQKEINSDQALRLYHSLNAAKTRIGQLEDHVFSLEDTIGTKDATIAGLQANLGEKEREAESLRASKEKAWDEADKTVSVANEAFKAKAAIEVSKNLREEGEQLLKEADAAVQTMSKLCSPEDVAKVKGTADEDIESVLQRMKSVLDSNATDVEGMD